jgi:hypothetical protein
MGHFMSDIACWVSILSSGSEAIDTMVDVFDIQVMST